MDEFAQHTEENFSDVRGEDRTRDGGLRGEMNPRFAQLEDKMDRCLTSVRGAGDRVHPHGPTALPRLRRLAPG